MKIALVHHWMTNMAGAERLLLELHKLYPEATIYTSVYDEHALPAFENATVKTTFLQKLPLKLRYKQQLWAPLRPLAFKMLDMREYDIVISSDSAEAKNVRVRNDAVHISYNNTPIRYYWSHYNEYKADPGFGPLNFIVRIALALMVRPLRRIDYKAAQAVDYFIANSSEVQRRIRTHYNRSSTVINPPVSYERFQAIKSSSKRTGFIIAGRQTPYKKFDLAIAACNELELPLTVIGYGTEHERLKALAGPTVTFETDVDDERMVELFHKGEAFIFPAEEDFGIVPIEAMAAGMPVLAYAKGGVVDWMKEGVTGEVFEEQTTESLAEALKKFDPSKYKKKDLTAQAESFSNQRFQLEIKEFVDSVTQNL